MTFRGHETFFIRKGWLGKGMKNVEKSADVFITKEPNPMDVLGIGSNMVKSLRYWMLATGLATEPGSGRRLQTLTRFGKLIFAEDRYLEELGTLQLLHYKLASNLKDATAWYYFFNVFNMQEYTKDDFVRALSKYVTMNNPSKSPAERVLVDDFNCLINTYMPRYKSSSKKISPENNIDCPLGELGLVDFINKDKKIYKKTTPSAKIFNPWITLAVIVDMAKGSKEISLNSLLHDECSLGRIFNLDVMSMLEILQQVERIGEIKIVRTAGLDVVKILNQYTFIECVSAYYRNINQEINKEEAHG